MPLRLLVTAAVVANGCSFDQPASWPTSSPPRNAVIVVNEKAAVATVDERFLSFAVDSAEVVGAAFWDTDGAAQAPYDFARPVLRRLAQELSPAYLRIGGTEADRVFYDMSDTPAGAPPEPYDAVLTRAEWDSLNDFAMELGLKVIFTLNAGQGPRDSSGAWDTDNARSLVAYTRSQSYPVAMWELGNEVGAYPATVALSFWVSPTQFVADVGAARRMLAATMPGALLGAPSSAYWPVWGEAVPFYPVFMAAGGGSALDFVTWHYYPQQSERCLIASRRADPSLMFEPGTLDEIDAWAAQVEEERDAHAPGKPVFLGETGNAQCGGEPGVSDAFAAGFWWLDELARMARRGEPVVVRQTLSGSDYGLIDDDTLAPRPDYWTSVLWRRLMGTTVLDVHPGADDLLRVYAQCTRPGAPDYAPGAITLAVVNLDPTTGVSLVLDSPGGDQVDVYELSAPEPTSGAVDLNGGTLTPAVDGTPPPLKPRVLKRQAGRLRATFGAATYGYAVLPQAAAAACGGGSPP